jgi:hypothetical protein
MHGQQNKKLSTVVRKMCIILYKTKKNEEVTIFLKNIFFWSRSMLLYPLQKFRKKKQPRLLFKTPKLERMADSEDKLHNVANKYCVLANICDLGATSTMSYLDFFKFLSFCIFRSFKGRPRESE